MRIGISKQLSAFTATELAVTQAKCSALVHAFNWSSYVSNGANSNVVDLVGDVVLNIGLTTGVSDGPDAYSHQISGSLIDTALVSGSWVQPGTKTCIVMSMHGNAAAVQLFIIGSSVGAAAADGIRVNRTLVNVFDFSASVTGTATAPALTDVAAFTAVRLTPGASLNSIQVGNSSVVINTETTTSIPATLDGLNNVYSVTGAVPYWGQLVLHCTNPPTDQAIAEAMAFMRPRWLRGEFVIAPNMLGWS